MVLLASILSITFITTELFCEAASVEYPIVQTKNGPVRGIDAKSRDGTSYFAFKGIPFAKPPVGKLRFQPPIEPEPWTDIMDAQKHKPNCLQKNYLFKDPKVEGSEDCLYLNVYTPQLRSQNGAQDALPVMIFINWGGYFAGYSTSDYLGPDYILDKSVILVTFNYRVGVLGFLSTSDDSAPGNYGLKDQVAAFKWVRDNIYAFGGDPNRVTIFGQSAGGASVQYHIVSPLSKGLFQQGISESGSALDIWARASSNQFALAQIQAQFMGCPSFNTTEQVISCLRDVDGTSLVDSGDKFKQFAVDPLVVFTPAIEKKTEKNPEPFLTKDPLEYIKNQDFQKVPWIVGTVRNEGLIRAAALLRQSQFRNAINQNFDALMPSQMGISYSTTSDNLQKVWTRLKDFYFLGKNKVDIEDSESVQNFINLYTDRVFTYGVYQSALYHSIKGHDPIWLYNFDYRGEYSYGNIFAATNETINFKWGVSHCDDLLYLFKTPALFPELKNKNDILMSQMLIKMWTNFAIYGDPTPKENYRTDGIWNKLNNRQLTSDKDKKMNYLKISGYYDSPTRPALNMKNGFYNSRMQTWEELPLYENIPELLENHVDPIALG